MPKPTQRFAAPLALGALLLTALVFAPGLDGDFVYDDYYLVQANPSLPAPGSLGHYLGTPLFAGAGTSDLYQWVSTGNEYWRPFVKLVFLAQYRIFGLNPVGWHAVGLAVHLACVLFVLLWLRRRIGWPHEHAPLAIQLAATLATLVFAVHPSRVEAVSWVSGSADLWMGFWVLVGLLVWDRRTRVAALLSGVCFGLAFLSKETAIVVPGCLALDVLARRLSARAPTPAPARPRSRNSKEPKRPSQLGLWVLATIPVVAVVLLRLAVLPRPQPMHLGSITAALARGVACFGTYLHRVVWPIHPSTQIGLVSPDWDFELSKVSLAFGIAGIVALAVLVWRALRHPGARPWLADAAWFVLPLVPVLQFVPLGYTTLAAERFLYVPLLGVVALVGRGALRAMEKATAVAARRDPTPRPLEHRSVFVPQRALWVFVGGVLVCALMTIPTLRFQPAFASNVALWRYELRYQPLNPLLHLYLARAERDRGQLDAALAAARTSYDEATRDDARTEAAVEWASIRLEMLATADPELDRLCDFFDALSAGGAPTGSEITLESSAGPLTARISGPFRQRLESTASFHSARAVANARAGRYAVAAAAFQRLLPLDRQAANYANLVRAQACAEQWTGALASLDDARRRYPVDTQLDALRSLVNQGKKLAAVSASDRSAQALEWAQLWLDLGASSLIRRELKPLPESAQVIAYLAIADALDGSIALAYDRIAEARRRYPDQAALWNAARAEVGRLAAPAQPVGKSDVDELFR